VGGGCTARTSSTFRYEIPGGAEFEATHLEGAEKFGGYVAVVGMDPRTVRAIPLSDERSPVPKDMEAKARELLKDYDFQEGVEIIAPRLVKPGGSQAAPRALDVALVTFGFEVNNESVWENGPSVLFVNETAFRLGGNCTWDPIFLTIQGKLHLAYTAQEAYCSGERILYVCDLSGEAPKKVYGNGRLSD
jgi:hypothetical protein